MNRLFYSLGGLLILLVLFFAVNILASASLRSARLDLTEENLYTLSPGSRSLAAAIDEPIALTFYFSRGLTTGQPAIQTYGQRVRELLEEFTRAAGDRIELTIIDPEPFSEAEDEAVQAGLRGVPMGRSGESLYFGLVGTNSIDGREVIALFDPAQEQFLEYEVSRLVYTLANPERKVVGVISGLQLDGNPGNPAIGMGPQPPWQIMNEIRRLFDVETFDVSASRIPDTVSVLLVIHPKTLPDPTIYAIDQYVLAGGRAVLFFDPHCEVDLPPDAAQNPMSAFQAKRDSDLPRLLEAWGVRIRPGVVAGDAEHARQVAINAGGRREGVSYVPWLSLTAECVDDGDAVTGHLKTINVAAAGVLERIDGAMTTMTPLISTGPNSATVEVMSVKLMPDPKKILNEFVAGDESFVIAARVQGDVKTAFPDGPPMVGDEDAAEQHLTESSEPISVIIVTDVDMLEDQFWVQRRRLGQIDLGAVKTADNGDFLANALDNLTGSNDLMSIRARGKYARSFDRVEALQKDAERQYLAEEQSLQETLQEAEQKLNDLQRQRPESGSLMMTPEQQAEIDRFNAQRVETRKQLRAVRLDLRKGIENLGTRLRVYNIVLMPAIVALIAIAAGVFRFYRRRAAMR